MNTNLNINLSDFAGVILALSIVGALLKNAWPTFPNRLIPLVTWTLGTAGYLAMTGGWSNPKQWLAAIVASATATGTHSGIKNTFQKDEPEPTPLVKPVEPKDQYDPNKKD